MCSEKPFIVSAFKGLVLALFGSMVFLSSLSTQAAETVVHLPTDWRSGEEYQLEMIKVRERYKNGSLQRSAEVRTPIDVEVLRKLDSGYVIRWTYGRTELLGGTAANDPMITELLNLVENLNIDLRTDAFGSVVGLENKDEATSMMRLAFETMIRRLEEKGMAEEQLNPVRAGMEQVLGTEMVEASALKEPAIFYLASGGSYQLGTRQNNEGDLPNPLGGRPFPSKAYFLLRELNLEEGRANIEWRQTMDPDEVATILQESITALTESAELAPWDKAKLSPVQVDDEAHFLFDTRTGWPISVTHERVSVIGPERHLDRLTIRVIAGR